jgi:hypothetical protein
MSAVIAFLLEPFFLLSLGIFLLLVGEWVDTGFFTFVGVLGLGYFAYQSNFDPRLLWLVIPYVLLGFAYSLYSYREMVKRQISSSHAWELKPENNKGAIVYWIVFWPVAAFVRITSRFTDTVFAMFRNSFQRIFDAEVQVYEGEKQLSNKVNAP